MAGVQRDPEKYELFAVAIALGKTIADAYVSAGFKASTKNSANANGRRLLKDERVEKRIAELREEYQQEVAKQQIEQHASGAIQDFLTRMLSIVDESVKTRQGRIMALCARRSALYQVLADRAVFAEHQDVPGGNTGMVVTSYKAVGMTRIKTHQVDLDILKEIREIEKQIAIESGQWIEKSSEAHVIKSVEDIPDSILEAMVEQGRLSSGRVVDVEPEPAEPKDEPPEDQSVETS